MKNIEPYLNSMDEEGYVLFNADRSLGQNQYASRYVSGKLDYPNFGDGLRWKNLDKGYHFIMIHRDDLEEFHRRVSEFQGANFGY